MTKHEINLDKKLKEYGVIDTATLDKYKSLNGFWYYKVKKDGRPLMLLTGQVKHLLYLKGYIDETVTPYILDCKLLAEKVAEHVANKAEREQKKKDKRRKSAQPAQRINEAA